MPFSVPPPARQDYTDQGGEWVDATIVWLRQLQDYVNRISVKTYAGNIGLELAEGPFGGIASKGRGDVLILETGEYRTVYNPGTEMTEPNAMCWVQGDLLVGWFCS